MAANNPQFFGRPAGPVRTLFVLILVAVLALLCIIVFRLNGRLDTQEKTNQRTLAAAEGIVEINDKVTQRLAQLTNLTGTAQQALNETAALAGPLAQLKEVVIPAAASIAQGRAGGEESLRLLTNVRNVADEIRTITLGLVDSATIFGQQGDQLLEIVQGIVDDVELAVASATRISNAIPLPAN
ncbi:MAG: hypothetical protein ACT4PW_00385 [Acidimicrobiia bacterium]